MPKITPFITEKGQRKLSENKLYFFVDMDATKPEISNEIESTFDVEVVKNNTMITSTGEKKALVTLSENDDAAEVLSRVGVF